MQMVEVKLLGELGRRFGRSYRFMANSPKDVISALSNQLAGFKDYLTGAHEDGIGFRLVDEDAEGMDYEEMMMPCRQLVIAPIISGGGNIGRILIGIALIALAFIPFGGARLQALLLANLPLVVASCLAWAPVWCLLAWRHCSPLQ
jgi:predicted phage tail protein